MKHIILLILLSFCIKIISAQNFSHKEIYDQDFVFTDGIYLTKNDFKNNKPIDKSMIISNFDNTNYDFYELITNHKTISILNDIGTEITIATDSIFGYCNDGDVYILQNSSFARIGIIGNICHFMGSKLVYKPPTFDPFTHPFGSQFGSYTNEPQQYMYEIESGELFEYNSSNMEKLLRKDSTLHSEFISLSNRKKNTRLFYYLRQYNFKHPLYIPVYN